MLSRLILSLLLAAPILALAADYTRFTEVPYAGDWQHTPPEKLKVEGTQRLWFVVPQSLRLGSVGGTAVFSNFTDAGFEFTPKCVWGDFTYRVRLLETPAERAQSRKGALQRTPHDTADLSWHDLPPLAGEDMLVPMEITEVIQLGRRFRATITLAEGTFPVAIEWIDGVTHADKGGLPMPDVMDLRYGPHAKHVLDLYYPQERGDTPLPTIVFIHGGGWNALNKAQASRQAQEATARGYAVAAVAYRYISEAGELRPPVAAPLYDAARAVQHLRYHAEELGLDKERFGFTGGSAGGATSIWLALHEDLADPNSADPIARESTRPQAALPYQAQSSLDPVQNRQWVPAMEYGSHAFFGRKLPIEEWLARRDETLPLIKVFSPYAHASADDPPIYFWNVGRSNVPDEDPTHHPKHTEMLMLRLREVGAPAWFWAKNQDSDEPRYNGPNGIWNFWADHLGKPSSQ
ncbi:MAG: alpha/beta hydrolase [Opitutales bacterium]